MLKAGITTFDPHPAGTKTLVLSPIFSDLTILASMS